MSGSYRFSLLRSNGWTRLGVTGAVAMLFLTPMLWAVGAFGHEEDSIPHAVIFLFAGIWFWLAVGAMFGWSVMGFVIRLKEPEDDEDAPHRPSGPPVVHPPHPPAGHPPSHGPSQAPHRPPQGGSR